MTRTLLTATFAFAVHAALWAQQPNAPIIERTESIIYEKRVTEKSLGTTPVAVTIPELPSLTLVEVPAGGNAALGNVPQTNRSVAGQSFTLPVAPSVDQSEIRALRLLIEAQGHKIDSIQHQISQQKAVAMTPETAGRPAKPLKRDNVSIGVYAGPNLSTYSTDEDSLDSKARVGYQLGVYVRGGGRLFGQLGVEYVGVSSKLYSKEDKGTSLNQISSTINTHYVQIPLQIGFRPAMTRSKRTGIRIQGGAELSYLLDTGKNDFKLTDDDYNKTVVNLLGGVGFDLGPVTLDVAYHHGIKDAYKAQNAKLRMLSASIGFKF
ncbi:hypothetical protein GCM10027347_39840 [Larkinella harenae]